MIKSVSIEINGQTLHAETGRIAKQASGSAVITLGETVVLVAAVSTDEVREGVDFLPLPSNIKRCPTPVEDFRVTTFGVIWGAPAKGKH